MFRYNVCVVQTGKRTKISGNRFIIRLLISGLLCLSGGMEISPVAAQFTKRRAFNYTRWSVEANAGIPFLVGNFTSFAAGKTYIGSYFEGGVGFQYNPIWGFRLSVGTGKNKLGARGYASDFLLGEDGMTYYLPVDQQTWRYKELYTKIQYFSAGVHADINLFNLFGGSASNYWFTVLLSPALYLRQHTPEVRTLADEKKLFSPGGRWCLGMGGDITLRVPLCRLFDLQCRTGIVWLTDNQFIGFDTPILARYNYTWTSVVGLVFKVPQRGKRGHLMYMPRRGECHWVF